MKRYTIIRVDGSTEEIITKKPLDYKELQKHVGGTVDRQLLKGRKVMWLNDNGKIIGLLVNERASELWRETYPIEQYPFINDQTIVGDVVIEENIKVV